MKIRIIKCDEPIAWYADKVGEVYEVSFERGNCYYIDNQIDSMSMYVEKQDAEVVEE